jgi:hypothetical protein
MGSSSWEAYTVGFVLVGSIGACSLFGWWLDSHFGTSYWLPILFFVGVGAGFREMFVTLSRINKQEKERLAAKRAKEVQAPLPRAFDATEESSVPAMERQRLFRVPPPPVPGSGTAAPDSPQEIKPEPLDEMLKRLLEEGETDFPPSSERGGKK